MALHVASVKEIFLSLQSNITHYFPPTVLDLFKTKLADELQDLYNVSV